MATTYSTSSGSSDEGKTSAADGAPRRSVTWRPERHGLVEQRPHPGDAIAVADDEEMTAPGVDAEPPPERSVEEGLIALPAVPQSRPAGPPIDQQVDRAGDPVVPGDGDGRQQEAARSWRQDVEVLPRLHTPREVGRPPGLPSTRPRCGARAGLTGLPGGRQVDQRDELCSLGHPLHPSPDRARCGPLEPARSHRRAVRIVRGFRQERGSVRR